MRKLFRINWLIWVGSFLWLACQSATEQSDENTDIQIAVASDSVDAATGLVVDDELSVVVGNCTSCHSAQLITQNRATREGWHSMIVWMQKNHKLWDLGENEAVILDYLEEHYAPEAVGRRKNLENIEWYDLDQQPS